MCLQIPDLGRVWSFGGNEEGHGSWVKLGHLSSSPGDQDPWSELEYLTPTQAPEVLTFCLPGAPAFFVCVLSVTARVSSLRGISSGLLQSQEEAIYVNTAVKKKKKTKTQTQLVTLSFGKEQQWPYHPYVYGNTNYFI